MKLTTEQLEQIEQAAIMSTAPPKDDPRFTDAASLIVFLDTNDLPTEVYPAEWKLDATDVHNKDQFIADVNLFANTRRYILMLMDHIREINKDLEMLASVVVGRESPHNLPDHLHKILEKVNGN